jgi:hypothetical protein
MAMQMATATNAHYFAIGRVWTGLRPLGSDANPVAPRSEALKFAVATSFRLPFRSVGAAPLSDVKLGSFVSITAVSQALRRHSRFRSFRNRCATPAKAIGRGTLSLTVR